MASQHQLLKDLNEKRYRSQNLNKKCQSLLNNRSPSLWNSPNQNLSHNQRKLQLLLMNQNLENQ